MSRMIRAVLIASGLEHFVLNTGNYFASGIYGDATLATRVKGEEVVEATIAGILKDIEELRSLRLPGIGGCAHTFLGLTLTMTAFSF